MQSPDIVIAGAGLIGLACALECDRRGLRAVVVERGSALQGASSAAAGMLAAHDPANPLALSDLARQSAALYPAFLGQVAAPSEAALPFETEWALEQDGSSGDQTLLPSLCSTGFRSVHEYSLDPRKLGTAVLAAVRRSGIALLEATPVQSVTETSGHVLVHTKGETIACDRFVDCTGAWSSLPVRPAKGQMLRVYAPGLLHSATHGNVVVRTGEIYLVPRLDGSVVIGATIEDAGFDTAVHEADMAILMQRAGALIPVLMGAPRIESWAGLRPDTPDHLPLIGRVSERMFAASGHFRNGILLAPATALVIGQLLAGEQPELDLHAFAPARFSDGHSSLNRAVFAQA